MMNARLALLLLGLVACKKSAPEPEQPLPQVDCDGGMECQKEGLANELGKGVPVDKPRAAALYRRSCELGHAPACNNMGNCYEFGTGVRTSKEQAIAFYERGCDQGSGGGCYNAARLTMNDEKRTSLFERACEKHDPLGCRFAGEIHIAGAPGVPKDQAKGLELLRRSCTLQDETACKRVQGIAGEK